METISTSNFKKGMYLFYENKPVEIVDFQHVKPGKGQAIVRTRLKDIVTGQVIDKTFRSGDKFNMIIVTKQTVQFSYKVDDMYYFMDMETYEEIPIEKGLIENELDFLKEGSEVLMKRFDDQIAGIELPASVILEVTETDPGFKGDTVSGGGKPAILETGVKINVPFFINVGEKIKVDTRNKTYIERA